MDPERARWIHLKSGGQAGTTKGSMNEQLLSIWFQPPNGMKFRHDDPAGTDSSCVTLSSKDNKEIVLCVRLGHKRNSPTGKGAVTAVVDVREGAKETCFSLAVACAHLDAKSDQKREKEASDIHKTLLEEPHTTRQNMAVCEETNGYIILGDLNYRLRQHELDAANKGQLFTTQDMLLAIKDHIRPKSENVGPAKPQSIFEKIDLLSKRVPGLEEYRCNSIAFQPPTYKAHTSLIYEGEKPHRNICKMFLEKAAGMEGSYFDFTLRQLLGTCYAGWMEETSSGLQKAWPVRSKHDEDLLQLGWLDRVCWKTNSPYIVTEDKDFARTAWRFAANILDDVTNSDESDHLPTFSKFHFEESASGSSQRSSRTSSRPSQKSRTSRHSQRSNRLSRSSRKPSRPSSHRQSL
eukprot:TRINITY_DN9123_c1_g1_i1.p1 TRINITY_DN9123_c1_g1~~TRINITY_DN9123_c1_g1_i1.p1  ORF type:complete len:406 (-),score=23.88 TRINITY_DN9123_c1_g1_i1:275-1492(-)